MAPIEERGIGAAHLEQPDAAGAERDGFVVGQRIPDAEAARHRNHLARAASAAQQPHRRRVQRLCQRRLHRDLPEKVVLEIVRMPAAAGDRPIEDRVVGPHAGLQRREPDEGLERGSGLAARQHRAVVATNLIGPATDQRAHRARCRIHHHHRDLGGIRGGGGPREIGGDGAVHRLLQRRVERRRGGGVGAVWQRAARLFLRPVGKPAGPAGGWWEDDRRGGVTRLGLGDGAGAHHRCQHFARARRCCPGIRLG